MSEQVKFEDDDNSEYKSFRFSNKPQKGLIIFLVRSGVVKNYNQALIIGSIIAGAILVVAIFFLKQSLAVPQIIEIRVR